MSVQVPAAKLPKEATDIEFRATEVATGQTASVRDHSFRQLGDCYAVCICGGAHGRISANATWMMPPARPSATPIRHAMV